MFRALTLIAFTILLVSPVQAETSTPSAIQTPTNMEDKIKLLVQENLSTTEAKLKEKVDLHTLVGFAGFVKTISSDNLTVESRGDLLQVTTSAKTALLKDGSTIKFSSLAIGDKVIFIGTSVKDDIILAKRITVIKDDPSLVTTTAIVSKITALDTKKKTITLNINGTEQTLAPSKKSTVKLDTLEVGQTILGIIKEYEGKLSISRAKVL